MQRYIAKKSNKETSDLRKTTDFKDVVHTIALAHGLKVYRSPWILNTYPGYIKALD